MTEIKSVTLFSSDKGGVGKTEMAALSHLLLKKAKTDHFVVEADHQKKLSALLGPAVDLSIDAHTDLTEMSRNRYAAQEHYDQLYEFWQKGNCIVDLGANVSTPVLTWLKESGSAELLTEDGVQIRVAAVSSPDLQALSAAYDVLERAYGVLGAAGRYHLILNDTTGLSGFSPFQNSTAYAQLSTLSKTIKLSVHKVPFCDSLLMAQGKAQGMNVEAILQETDRLAKEMGLNRIKKATHERKLVKWVYEAQESLSGLIA